MIRTQRITSINQNPIDIDNFTSINVLKWNNSKWKTLCPYYMRTDGNEINFNPGNIIFENFYQGSKIYNKVYPVEVYPHRNLPKTEKYLKWRYITENEDGDIICNNNEINYDLYLKWRDSLWKCDYPIRYPNGKNKGITLFTLCIKKDKTEKRIDYLTSRKEIYLNEYVRLVKKTEEYHTLLNYLMTGKNLLICEIDVPARGKKGEYGKDCDMNNTCSMSLEKINKLLNDPNEAFGHGLCLAYSLLKDTGIEKNKKITNYFKVI